MRAIAIFATSALLLGAVSLEAQDPNQETQEYGRVIHRAVATYYPSLLRGAALPDKAHAIWFIADDQGKVMAHGVREALPSTVGFKAIPAILPALNGREYHSVTMTKAAVTGPGSDVSVLWVVLGKVPRRAVPT
jgi:hypothetical protein